MKGSKKRVDSLRRVTCSRCGKKKKPSQFHRQEKAYLGIRSRCKACSSDLYLLRKEGKKDPISPFVPRTKICPSCKKEKPLGQFPKNVSKYLGISPYCLLCNKENSRIFNARHPGRQSIYNKKSRSLHYEERRKEKLAWKKANPEKVKAGAIALYAIKTSKLVPEPCILCGVKTVQAHHEDYNKPLKVTWLCSVHHSRLHSERRSFAKRI